MVERVHQVILNMLASVGDFGKAGRKNCAMECSNIGARKGTYDAVILDKVERS